MNALIPQSGISTLEKETSRAGQVRKIFRLMILPAENQPAFY